jgi:hypothetical protein
MVQLRDVLNLKINKNNKQVSLDVKKTKLKELDMDISDILALNLRKHG